MKVFTSISRIREARRKLYKNKKVGLVPTMGALHQGHLSLIQYAQQDCEVVGSSIFVNPKQFAPHEDLQKYPRPLHDDISLLNSKEVDFLFLPSVEEMYNKNFSTQINVGFENTIEGKARPGHFIGVATVVTKLFNIVQPDRAYFGQKDALQCLLIKKMVKDLNIPVKVVICPTLREKDGLAMSSRNRYLSTDERKIAPFFAKALNHGKSVYLQGERDASRIIDSVKQMLEKEIPNVKFDYISIDDASTASSTLTIENEALLSGAIFVGKTRLIDNVFLSSDEKYNIK